MRAALLTCCVLTTGLLMAAPRFIGAEAYGVRPGDELIWRVPVHAAETVEAVMLPEGLTFDPARRVLRGTIAEAGDYPVVLKATGDGETVEQTLTVRVGETICLAPPMGWNSWYSYSEAVSQEGIEKVARLLDSTGLADYGWSYVNIDDCWQGERPEGKALQSNARFPDMKAMCDRIHALGLKAGIYTSPWVGTYAGFRGSSCDPNPPELAPEKRLQPGQVFGRYPGLHRLKVDHVGSVWMFDADAKQFADWGFDYVKLDWNPNDVPTTEKMYAGLRSSGRDIVMSLSNTAPLKNAPGLSKVANLWRTTADIVDNWGSIRHIGRAQLQWLKFRSEGHWNDPDILQVGRIGTPNQQNTTFRPSGLKQHEQHYQVALWCMLSAPLLISSDLENMAPETKALLTDPDLIELDQKYASAPLFLTRQTGAYFVLRKDITEEESVHGIFNDSNAKQTVTLPDGSRHEVAPHSAKLVRLPAGAWCWTYERDALAVGPDASGEKPLTPADGTVLWGDTSGTVAARVTHRRIGAGTLFALGAADGRNTLRVTVGEDGNYALRVSGVARTLSATVDPVAAKASDTPDIVALSVTWQPKTAAAGESGDRGIVTLSVNGRTAAVWEGVFTYGANIASLTWGRGGYTGDAILDLRLLRCANQTDGVIAPADIEKKLR